MTTYAQSGVDTFIEEKAARMLYAAAKATWANRGGKLGEVVTPFDDFSGLRAMRVGGLPEGTLVNIGLDGVGTKTEIAELMGRYDTLAFDLLAMVCDDAAIRGGEPVAIGSILDVNSLGTDETRLAAIKSLAAGYVEAARVAEVAIVNGEIAQLGTHVGGSDRFRLSWGAAALWFGNEQRMITGHDVRPGDTIIALAEPGLRANGITLIRTVLEKVYGPRWVEQDLDGTMLGELALVPSTIYAPTLTDLVGGWELSRRSKARFHAASHITGGGIPSKLGRTLRPSKLGATIDEPMQPPALMLHVQQLANVSDYEAYQTWHMGQGMLIVTSEPHPVMAIARGHKMHAAVVGTITAEPVIRIASRGYFAKKERWLDYDLS